MAVEALQEALWDLVWAGEVTNDAWAPLRAPRLALARRRRRGAARRPPLRPGGARLARLHARARCRAAGRSPPASSSRRPIRVARRRTLAELLLERYGILTRELVLAEGVHAAASPRSTTRWPRSRRSASAGAATSSRASAAPSSRCPGPSSGCAPSATSTSAPPLVLAAADPAQPYGAALPWPVRSREGRRPSRVAGRTSCSSAPSSACYVEAAGRGLQTFATGEPLRAALVALADAVRAGRVRRLELERVDGEAVLGSAVEPLLVELGFRAGPRRLTLSA